MASAKYAVLYILAGIIFQTALPVHAHAGTGFPSGQKYRNEKGIDLRKPIGPGSLEAIKMSQTTGNSGGDGISRPYVHPDMMTSYSDYFGYTIRKIYTYSANEDLEELLTEVQTGEAWTGYERSIFTYDAKGNVLSELVAQYYEGEWIDLLLLSYTYNKAGLCTTLTYYDILSDFTERITMYYDHQRNRVKELGQWWDGVQYVNLEQWTYTYNNQRDMLTMYGQFDYGSGWFDYMRERWTYLSKGKVRTDMIEYSDGATWYKDLLLTNTYNKTGYVGSFTASHWNDLEGWVAEYGVRYSYDKPGNMVSSVLTQHGGTDHQADWVATDSTANSFNYCGMKISALGYVKEGHEWVRGETSIYVPFNDHGNILVFADEYPSNRVEVLYSRAKPGHEEEDQTGEGALLSDAGSPENSGIRVSVNPNPFSDAFTVVINCPEAENYTISLLNSQGKPVQQVFSGELVAGRNEIGVKSIASPAKGLFFLNAVSPTRSHTMKLIRQ